MAGPRARVAVGVLVAVVVKVAVGGDPGVADLGWCNSSPSVSRTFSQ